MSMVLRDLVPKRSQTLRSHPLFPFLLLSNWPPHFTTNWSLPGDHFSARLGVASGAQWDHPSELPCWKVEN